MILLLALACASGPKAEVKPDPGPSEVAAPVEAAPATPVRLVGVAGGALVRLEVDPSGGALRGAFTVADGAAQPVSGQIQGDLWSLPVEDARLEGRWDGAHLVGNLGAEAVVLGDGLDPVALVARTETWRRAEGSSKPDPEIPVSLPQVWVADPARSAAIAALLTPEALLGQTRAQIEADGWVDSVSFEATWQKAGLLSLSVIQEGSAAYPDGVVEDRVIDLAAGARLGAEVWDPAQQPALVARLDQALGANIRAAQAEAASYGEDAPDPSLYEGHAVKSEVLAGYGLRPEGVVFHYNFGFPHVIQAAEPDGDLLLPWREVGTYAKADSAVRRGITP